MLKAVIVDSNAVSRGLLNTVLTEGSYEVIGQTHTGAQGFALAQKYRPHIVCVARDQIEDGSEIVEQLRQHMPKVLIFMVSGTLDATSVQEAVARGVHGFIVRPFKADAVLRTIRNTVIAVVKKHQAAAQGGGVEASGAAASGAAASGAAASGEAAADADAPPAQTPPASGA